MSKLENKPKCLPKCDHCDKVIGRKNTVQCEECKNMNLVECLTGTSQERIKDFTTGKDKFVCRKCVLNVGNNIAANVVPALELELEELPEVTPSESIRQNNNEEVNRLKDVLALKVTEYNNLKAKSDVVSLHFDQVTKKVGIFEKDYNDALATIASQKVIIQRCEEKVINIEIEKARVISDSTDVIEVQVIKNDLVKEKEENGALKNNLAVKTEENMKLNEEKLALTEKTKQLEREKEALKDTIDDQATGEHGISDSSNVIEVMKNDLEKEKEENVTLKDSLAVKTEENLKLNEEKLALTEKTKQLEREKEALKDRANGVNGDNDVSRYKEFLRRAQEECKTLENEMKN